MGRSLAVRGCAGDKSTARKPLSRRFAPPPPHPTPYLPQVPPGASGCIVVKLETLSDAARVLQLNDVIMELDGVPIAGDETVPFRDDERLDYSHSERGGRGGGGAGCPRSGGVLVLPQSLPEPNTPPQPPTPTPPRTPPPVINMKHVGETLRVKLLRGGEVLEVEYTLGRQHPLVRGSRAPPQRSRTPSACRGLPHCTPQQAPLNPRLARPSRPHPTSLHPTHPHPSQTPRWASSMRWTASPATSSSADWCGSPGAGRGSPGSGRRPRPDQPAAPRACSQKRVPRVPDRPPPRPLGPPPPRPQIHTRSLKIRCLRPSACPSSRPPTPRASGARSRPSACCRRSSSSASRRTSRWSSWCR
jgi:hypothetical protein